MFISARFILTRNPASIANKALVRTVIPSRVRPYSPSSHASHHQKRRFSSFRNTTNRGSL